MTLVKYQNELYLLNEEHKRTGEGTENPILIHDVDKCERHTHDCGQEISRSGLLK